MAGRLIVMKSSSGKVNGDCMAEGFEGWVRVQTLGFSAAATLQRDSQTSSVHHPSVTLTIPFGPWVAELQSCLYNGTDLGTVDLVELEQKVDGQNKKVWKKVRELKLAEAWLESLNHSWETIHANVGLQIEFNHIHFAWGDKVADFKRDETP